jgi:hypothetical protein
MNTGFPSNLQTTGTMSHAFQGGTADMSAMNPNGMLQSGQNPFQYVQIQQQQQHQQQQSHQQLGFLPIAPPLMQAGGNPQNAFGQVYNMSTGFGGNMGGLQAGISTPQPSLTFPHQIPVYLQQPTSYSPQPTALVPQAFGQPTQQSYPTQTQPFQTQPQLPQQQVFLPYVQPPSPFAQQQQAQQAQQQQQMFVQAGQFGGWPQGQQQQGGYQGNPWGPP